MQDAKQQAQSPSVEVFYDVSSPWTYLGFHRLAALEADLGMDFVWRPILVGGIFNAVNPSVYASRENPVPAKAHYMLKDLGDWAAMTGLKIIFPPRVFPVNSVKAMRACIVAEGMGRQKPLARAFFELYWSENEDISQDEVVARACARAGIDASHVAQAIQAPDVKEKLKANADEAMRRGAFGSPTIFVNGDDMYFGNDRLPLIERAIRLPARRP